MLQAIKGDRVLKQQLFDLLIDKLQSDQELEPEEMAVFEYLKKELTSAPIVVELSATLAGKSQFLKDE